MAEHKGGSRILADAQEGISTVAHDVVNAATDMASSARDKVVEYGQAGYKRAAKKTKEYRETAEGYIEDNPWRAVGIALGVGVLVGLLLKRHRD